MRCSAISQDPPISSDDLKTVLDTRSLAPKTLRNNPIAAGEIVQVIRDALDRRRFPWVAEEREPSEAERIAAVLASSALIATRRTETQRRTEGKSGQEALVQEMLVQMGFIPVQTRDIRTIAEAPRPGEFCAESPFGGRKADFIVGLRDDRIMPIECKVSNSATNSVKRLNNDAAVKAVSWRTDFGVRQVVPTAVLSGVFALRNLVDAQARGLTLFWAHDLPRLREWIESATK